MIQTGNMNKVSIVIAVYNCQDYIQKCVNSALSQSMQSIEIIVVDDASTDNTKNILSQIRGIRVITLRSNSGPGKARNVGLDSCSGEYILFMDGDDCLSPKMLEEMYEEAIKNDSDIVFCDYLKEYKEASIPSNETIFKKSSPKKNDFILMGNMVWNRICKLSFLHKYNIRFPNEKCFFRRPSFSFKFRVKCKCNIFGAKSLISLYKRQRKLSFIQKLR